jgi:hypothetical protein
MSANSKIRRNTFKTWGLLFIRIIISTKQFRVLCDLGLGTRQNWKISYIIRIRSVVVRPAIFVVEFITILASMLEASSRSRRNETINVISYA